MQYKVMARTKKLGCTDGRTDGQMDGVILISFGGITFGGIIKVLTF